MTAIKGTILMLCAIGLYASTRMALKAARAARGELAEPSVVMTARARVFGRVPNAAVGLAYYGALAVVTLLPPNRALWTVTLTAAALAAAFSLYLAYSLLFVTRMSCILCWTGHAVNWLLLACLSLLGPAAT